MLKLATLPFTLFDIVPKVGEQRGYSYTEKNLPF